MKMLDLSSTDYEPFHPFKNIPDSLKSQECLDLELYKTFFLGKNHVNYVSKKTSFGPVCISFKIIQKTCFLIIRTQEKNENIKIQTDGSTKKTFFSIINKIIFKLKHNTLNQMLNIIQHPLANQSFKKTTKVLFPERIVEFEKKLLNEKHRIGVLSIKESEENNKTGLSKKLKRFLSFIGGKIHLNDWNGYKGCLDTSQNTTGNYSFYTELKEEKIMFHVSDLLPKKEIKKYIGNDICVIIFNESENKTCLCSYLSKQTHIIVEVIPNENKTYKASFYKRKCVPMYQDKKNSFVIEETAEERELFLKTIILNERNVYKSSKYIEIKRRIRTFLLNELIELNSQ